MRVRGAVKKLVPLMAVVALATVGCAWMQEEAAHPSRPAAVYANAIEPEDGECMGVRCDRFTFDFKAGDRARFEVRATTEAMVVEVWTEAERQGVTARAAPSESAAVVWEVERDVELHVEMKPERGDVGIVDYELAVSPGPVAARRVPPPVRSWADRIAQIATRAPIPELAMTDVEAQRRLKKQLAEEHMAIVPVDVTAPLAAFTPVRLPLEAGYCYRIGYHLSDGATLGPFASRGLELTVRSEERGREQPALTILGSHALTGRICPRSSEDAEVTLRGSFAPRDARHDGELGAGTVAFTLHRVPVFPGVHSAEDLAARVAESTAGFSLVRSFGVDLATLEPVPLTIERGTCYVAAMHLAPGATWSRTSIEQGMRVVLDSEDGDVSGGPGVVGPGAVSVFGCARRTRSARLQLDPLGTVDGVGTGTLEVQLYGRTMKPGELEAMIADEEADAEALSRSIERTTAEHCARCRRDNWGDKDGLESCAAQIGPRDGCY